MSVEAMAYALNLERCEDGAELSQSQKLLLMILANYHNTRSKTSWPSLPTLAEQCLCSEDTIRRAFEYLERHCTVLRVKPERQGRKQITEYMLLGFDRRDVLAQKLAELAAGKGSHGATLFCPEKRVAEGSQIEPERVAEGSQKTGERVAEGSQKGRKVSGHPIENKESRARTGTGTKATGTKATGGESDCSALATGGETPPHPDRGGYSQRDFDERDYRKFCEQRDVVRHWRRSQEFDQFGHRRHSVEAWSDDRVDREAAKRAGITPQRMSELLAMEAAR